MSEPTKTECACGSAPKLIYPCSGSSDVGGISDQAARRMSRTGAGRMHCLAGIGGRVPDIMTTAKTAAAILAIDGCSLECAKLTLEEAGFSGFLHLKLAELGLKKGNAPANDRNIEKVVSAGRELLDRAKV